MLMEPKKHLLNDVWNQFPKVISNEYTNEIVIPDLEHFFANVFSVGSFYYYILNFKEFLSIFICNFFYIFFFIT